MKVSKKSRYGLRAMVELALYYKEGPLSARRISEIQGIPLQYLEQILNRLKKARLIKTTRGPRGGYLLSREPSKIKLGNIIETLEDKNFLVDCLAGKGKNFCSRVDVCKTRGFWERLARSLSEVMNSTTLQDLCQGSKTINRNTENSVEHHYLFQI